MKDFENLSPEEQTDVIMQIGSKLTKQEIWYWEGIIHLLRERDNIIKEAREHIHLAQTYGKRKYLYINGDDVLEILDKVEEK